MVRVNSNAHDMYGQSLVLKRWQRDQYICYKKETSRSLLQGWWHHKRALIGRTSGPMSCREARMIGQECTIKWANKKTHRWTNERKDQEWTNPDPRKTIKALLVPHTRSSRSHLCPQSTQCLTSAVVFWLAVGNSGFCLQLFVHLF